MVQGLSDAYRGGPEGALFESLYEQFREDRGVVEGILAELGYTSRSAKRLAGQCDRECPSCGGWRRAGGSVVVPNARGARHRRAGQAMSVASRTGARSLFRTRQAVGASSNWKRMRSINGRPSSGIAAQLAPLTLGACRPQRTRPRRTTESQSTSRREVIVEWFRDRALTLVLMAMFLVFLAAQMVTGLYRIQRHAT